jgi:hypothetical protein
MKTFEIATGMYVSPHEEERSHQTIAGPSYKGRPDMPVEAINSTSHVAGAVGPAPGLNRHHRVCAWKKESKRILRLFT